MPQPATGDRRGSAPAMSPEQLQVFERTFPIHQLFERSCELGLWRLTADKITERRSFDSGMSGANQAAVTATLFLSRIGGPLGI
jgi:hypothetical protein